MAPLANLMRNYQTFFKITVSCYNPSKTQKYFQLFWSKAHSWSPIELQARDCCVIIGKSLYKSYASLTGKLQ